MRNKEEEKWKKLEGKLLHITIGRVQTYGPGEVQVNFQLIETGKFLSFIVECEED